MSFSFAPLSASIDFCEENYGTHSSIVEFHNSWTSLLIALFGFLGAYLHSGLYKKTRFLLCWLFFVLVGCGSALFHATLSRFWQATDELPMVAGNCLFLFCLYSDRTHFFYSDQFLAPLALLLFLFKFALYVVFENYACFFLAYGVGVLFLVFGALQSSKRSSQIRKLALRSFSSYGLGFGLWTVENAFCEEKELSLQNLHLHCAWHLLAGLGTYFYVVFLIALDMETQGKKVLVDWRFWGLFPRLQESQQVSIRKKIN